jgi:chorismate synthase
MTPNSEQVDIVVRAVRSHDEYVACVRLQRDTWGEQFSDAVPASILLVGQKIGGVTAGAFAADELVGFVFGLTGVRDGRLVHWSDMLAVRPEYQNQGIGQRLKQYQREAVRALGVEVMHWTFDPLVARNAHLNLNRLGVDASEYVVDMYGPHTGSDLHAAGTDRFIVSWAVSQATRPRADESAWREAPVATEGEESPLQRVEIPLDITRLAIEDARRWRHATRAAFTRLLGSGYRVAGFYSDDSGAWYVLSRC